MKRLGNVRVAKDYSTGKHVIEGRDAKNGTWVGVEDDKKPLEFETEEEAVKWLEDFLKNLKKQNLFQPIQKSGKPKGKTNDFLENQSNRRKNERRRKNKTAAKARRKNKR